MRIPLQEKTYEHSDISYDHTLRFAAHSSVRAVGLSFLQLFPDFILENSAVWLCTGAERHADDLVFDAGFTSDKKPPALPPQ